MAQLTLKQTKKLDLVLDALLDARALIEAQVEVNTPIGVRGNVAFATQQLDAFIASEGYIS